MRLIAKVVGVTAVAALALTGCGRAADSGSSGGSGSTGGSSAGFPANATIGVALPQKTSENWVLAEGLFNDGLKEAGFTPDVQFANGGVSEQQNQIQAMITKQAKVIVIGAIDGAQLGTQVKAAKDSGAIVIAYDRLIKNTPDVDYYVAYDNFKVGQLQGQALLDGMKAKKPNGPYNIELFAGSPDDANAQVFFDGAMDVLKPKIDDGTLKVASGQTGLQPGRHAGLEGRERPEADGHAPVGQLHQRHARRRALARTTPSPGRSSPRSRPPASPSRSSPVRTPRSSRSSRSWPASSTPPSTRTPASWWPRRSRWSQALQKGQDVRRSTTPSVQQRCQGRPGLPAHPGDRHQGERQGGLRQRPDAPRDRQRGG